MSFLTSGLFWGFILVLLGLSIIVRILFNIDVPVFKVVFGLILIYLGFQVLFGSPTRFVRHHTTVRRTERRFDRAASRVDHRFERAVSRVDGRIDQVTSEIKGDNDSEPEQEKTNRKKTDRTFEENEYNVVFGGSTIDLTDLSKIPANHKIEINVVFGSALVLLGPEVSVTIKNSTVFGESIFPGKTVSFFGNEEFDFGTKGDYQIFIETNTVFGSLEIKVVEK